MEALILREGGVPFVAPSVREEVRDAKNTLALSENQEPLREAAERIANGGCDVVLFTSSVQLDHLLMVAASMGLEAEVRAALKKRLVVGSIGPVMNDALAAEGIAPDIVPRRPKMWALVKAAAEQAAAVMAVKAA